MMEGLETKRQLPVPGNIWSSPTAPPPSHLPFIQPPLRLKDKMLGHFTAGYVIFFPLQS